MSEFKTIEWKNNEVIMLDQTKLPETEHYVHFSRYEDVADAIRKMVIRGAPAIGVAAAMGIALGTITIPEDVSNKSFLEKFAKICDDFSNTRPTAVNLFWAIERMKSVVKKNNKLKPAEIKKLISEEATLIASDDLETCKKIGTNGSEVIADNSVIMTHCNAGALATSGYGTALGVIRAAKAHGKSIKVISSETRPFLQGARLTAWELDRDGIPVTLITDSMAGMVMSAGMVDCIVVGADRIASNGDVANKIGTYTLSVLAKHHGIPFYVAAPVSTIDFDCSSGASIPIEQRDPREVTHIMDKRIAARVEVLNPAFDITPNENVTSIITEQGILKKPYADSIRKIKRND